MSAYEEENARAIGELQARVDKLEGTVDGLYDSHLKLQQTVFDIQSRELERGEQRLAELGVPAT